MLPSFKFLSYNEIVQRVKKIIEDELANHQVTEIKKLPSPRNTQVQLLSDFLLEMENAPLEAKRKVVLIMGSLLHIEEKIRSKFDGFWKYLSRITNPKKSVVYNGIIFALNQYDGYQLKLMYDTKPSNDTVAKQTIYLYLEGEKLEYAARNEKDIVQRIILSNEVGDEFESVRGVLRDPAKQQRLNKKENELVFAATSKRKFFPANRINPILEKQLKAVLKDYLLNYNVPSALWQQEAKELLHSSLRVPSSPEILPDHPRLPVELARDIHALRPTRDHVTNKFIRPNGFLNHVTPDEKLDKLRMKDFEFPVNPVSFFSGPKKEEQPIEEPLPKKIYSPK